MILSVSSIPLPLHPAPLFAFGLWQTGKPKDQRRFPQPHRSAGSPRPAHLGEAVLDDGKLCSPRPTQLRVLRELEEQCYIVCFMQTMDS